MHQLRVCPRVHLAGHAVFLLVALACAPGAAPPAATSADRARGVVFHDRDGDGVRDPGEWGIRGVRVSNGRDVVRTDWRGRYSLPVGDDTILFVIKPRDFAPPTGPLGLPQFYYVHRPAGSPPGLAFPGIAPTGPLPESIDFPLERSPGSDQFRMLLFGDPQPYTLEEVDFFSRDIVEPLIGADVAFGMSLGDLVGDDLALFGPLNRAVAHIGVPWYNVVGNHDLNYRASDDAASVASFERVYGPANYAFQYGRVHFIVLDDVVYRGWNAADDRQGGYDAGLSTDQLAFVRNVLATVPREDLVVLALHIPIGGIEKPFPQRRELLEILSTHPHTASFAAHAHIQAHVFFGPEDGYTGGGAHHHLIHATTSGSWWLGAADELGLPHATMRCGAPNGYSIVRFDGNRYEIDFRAARRPASYQMNVMAPDAVARDEVSTAEVLVNVFAGSERSVVEMRVRGVGDWQVLERVERPDPLYLAIGRREADLEGRRGYKLPPPIPSPHLWAGTLPPDVPPGTALLDVRATDMFGRTHTAHRLIRVE
jgi:hypothetical protein